MKQTAVEWFYQRILAKDIKQVFEQALAMEKEQIEDAFEQGIEDGYWHPENGYNKKYDSAEQYYNKTYGKTA